ncbi:autotransporter-associated N-terminal domain-containing protein, partial [Fusobacterium necrophorum]
MKKSEMEKTLKRYLKRKIRYSFSFLIAFLITGTFSFASELSRKELLLRIKIEREKLEEMLRENERSLNKLRKENIK